MKRYIANVTRWYYRLLDFTQRNWARFRATEVGAFTAWLAPRLLRWTWLYLKWSMAFLAAFMLFSYGLMIFMLLIVTGNGKAAMSSFTKITVVIAGLFAASKLIEKKAEVAKVVTKAIGP